MLLIVISNYFLLFSYTKIRAFYWGFFFFFWLDKQISKSLSLLVFIMKELQSQKFSLSIHQISYANFPIIPLFLFVLEMWDFFVEFIEIHFAFYFTLFYFIFLFFKNNIIVLLLFFYLKTPSKSFPWLILILVLSINEFSS